jgi:lipopolysaccharide export system permease protein
MGHEQGQKTAEPLSAEWCRMNRVARMVARMIVLRFIPILTGLSLFVLTLEVVAYAKEILALNDSGIAMIGKYIAFRAPATMATFLPISLLLALLLTVTELSYRNEITAMWSIGLSPMRLIIMLAPVALLIGLFHFVLVDRLVPAAAPTLRSWGIADYGEKKLKIGERDPIWLRSGPDIMRAASANRDASRLTDVTIFRRDNTGILLEQIYAASASREAAGWILQNAVVYGRDAGAPRRSTQLVYSGTMRAAQAGSRSGDPEEMTLGDLSYFIDNNGFGIRPAYVYQAWWHKRISLIFVSFIMLALVVPLATRFRRGGGLGMLFALGVGLGFAFFILDGIAMSVGELGVVYPWLAAWLPVLVFGFIALYLLSRSERV